MFNRTAAVTMGELYPLVLAKIMNDGFESAPREIRTRELLGHQIFLEDARSNVFTGPERDINFRFMLAEWLWIMAGKNDVASIARYNKNIAQFSDNGQIFNGAYGPRLSPQWQYVLEALKKPDSRQAVMTIWTPAPGPSKDIPCTISLQFLIRNNTLHTIATMRSSDVFLGFPHDLFNFSMIGNAIAGELQVDVGSITMQLGSFHLYERDWERADAIVQANSPPYISSPCLPGFPPASQMLEKALDEKWMPPYFGMPWDRYTHALSVKTKAECLHEIGKLQ